MLVVDDDASVRRALRRLLRAAGYEVEVFDSGAAYLEREASDAPACLVLDVRMPVMGGLELQRAIDGTSRDLPIVFITGHGDDEVRNRALAAGAVEILDKPLDQAVLLEAIDRAIKRGEQ